MNDRDLKYTLQIFKSLDDSQLQWIIDHDYDEKERILADEELVRRGKG